MTKKVFIFGASGTGKTELLRQLTNQKVTSGNDYKPTKGPDFQLVNEMMVWDSTGTNGEYKTSSYSFRGGVNLGIYCINLSQEVNEEVLQQIKSDLISLRSLNPNAEILLVGTFSDQALEENTVQSLRDKLDEFDFIDVLTVTTVKRHGTLPLLMALNRYKKDKERELGAVHDGFPNDSEREFNKLEILRDGLPDNSDLYSALNKLNNQVIRLGLNADEIDVLGDEVHTLFAKITDSLLLDKTDAYNKFLENCDAKFTEKYHGLKAAVKTFAAVVLVTALAAGLFFGLGVVCGAWAGASTFFAALVEGTTGAAAFAAGTSVTNLTSLTYFGNSFFQKPVKNAASEFIENVKNANIEF
ncbi:MAG: 50S ribosome-binding GTPase [Legionella sp.]|uniref:Rab family GTPase n=1 Tax=Legionella sp. TaxID=459 RepID=UPI0028423219|nr:50S ribosome-binding GTPase [Legionella sp.]